MYTYIASDRHVNFSCVDLIKRSLLDSALIPKKDNKRSQNLLSFAQERRIVLLGKQAITLANERFAVVKSQTHGRV